MSASGADVTRTSLISNPRESKRGACDRCRGQKLRCLREDQSQDSTCVRCFKAGAVCSFGTPKRAGRPRGSSSYSPQERRGNGGGNPKHSRTPSRPTANTNGHGVLFESKVDGGLPQNSSVGWDDSCFVRENTAEEESGGETEDTIPAHAMSPSSLFDTSKMLGDFPAVVGSSTATLPWSDDAFTPYYNDNAGEVSGLESFGPKYSWAFQQYHAGPMDMQMLTGSPLNSDGQTRDVGINGYATAVPSHSTNVQLSRPLDEAMDLDVPTALIQPTIRESCARDHEKGAATSFSSSLAAKPFQLRGAAASEAGSIGNEESLSVQEGQRRRMQELSELAMELYTQLAANNLEDHQPASATAPATAFQDQLVGIVLKSSTTFLTLLLSFAHPDSLDASTCSSDVSSPDSASDNDDQPDNNSTSDSPSTASHPPVPPPPSTTSSGTPLPPTDMPTILQLLTCYIRIVRLHGIMYDHLLTYTQQALPSGAAVPPVFPGLTVGGVPLDAFGPLQLGLLLQIAVHLLGAIEVALGLPDEYRVGRRRGGGRGVLGASVSSGFVRCLMREGVVWRGKRRVEGMREQLVQLRRVLKGAAGEG
ncbi:hypothetical protein MMC15_006909 [Xylographa vitiligo]|nr:hypothetical protein [Xylographa vitiligo]